MLSVARAWYGIDWNESWSGWKFPYGIWKMPQWSEMKDFKKGIEEIFHTFVAVLPTRFRSWYLQRNIYGYWQVKI